MRKASLSQINMEKKTTYLYKIKKNGEKKKKRRRRKTRRKFISLKSLVLNTRI